VSDSQLVKSGLHHTDIYCHYS